MKFVIFYVILIGSRDKGTDIQWMVEQRINSEV